MTRDEWLEGVSYEWTEGSATRVGDLTGHRRVLILEGRESVSSLVSEFVKRSWEVWHSSDPLRATSGLDLVVVWEHDHEIESRALLGDTPIVKLHLGYLPFNRGAHPAFWCFYDGTPCGVSVHLVDEGLDEGPIIAKRLVELEIEELTFRSANERLRAEAEDLFWKVLDAFLDGSRIPEAQQGRGSFHVTTDLPGAFRGDDRLISDEVMRLHGLERQIQSRALELLEGIESVRKANNVNWMDLARLSFREAPLEAQKIFRRIQDDDNKIASLLEALGNVTLDDDSPSKVE